MLVFIIGVSLFAIGFALHVILWRIRLPRNQAATLVLLFLAVGALGFFAMFALDLGLGPLRLLLAILLFGSFGVVYLILFSAIEADSPTLTILGLIQKSGRGGISHDDLMRALARHSYVRARLDQMLRDGMAVRVGDRIRPGTQGLLLTSLILQYRKLLGRGHAGG